MAYFEHTLFTSENNLINHVFSWHRYVDDVFCIWKGTYRQLDSFLKLLNSIDNNINFTVEKEINQSLNFLDLTITRCSNKLNFNVYRKPTSTDTIIPANSCHPIQTKYAVFHSFINRLLNLPLSKIDYINEINTIKLIAKNNDYDPTIIDKIIERKLNKKITKLLYNDTLASKTLKRYSSIHFINTVSFKFRNRLKKLGICAIENNNRNLNNLLVNNKPKIDALQKSGIYKLYCNSCDATYIGQSGRAVKTRIGEHLHSIKKKDKKTGFSEHCTNLNHNLDLDKVKILHHNIKKSKRLTLLENLEIKKALHTNTHLVNNQTELGHYASPLLLCRL